MATKSDDGLEKDAKLIKRGIALYEHAFAEQAPDKAFPNLMELVAFYQDEIGREKHQPFFMAVCDRFGPSEAVMAFQGMSGLLQTREAMLLWKRKLMSWIFMSDRSEEFDNDQLEKMHEAYFELRRASEAWKKQLIVGLAGLDRKLVEDLCLGADSVFFEHVDRWVVWLGAQPDERYEPANRQAMIQEYIGSSDGFDMIHTTDNPMFAPFVEQYQTERVGTVCGAIMSQGLTFKYKTLRR